MHALPQPWHLPCTVEGPQKSLPVQAMQLQALCFDPGETPSFHETGTSNGGNPGEILEEEEICKENKTSTRCGREKHGGTFDRPYHGTCPTNFAFTRKWLVGS